MYSHNINFLPRNLINQNSIFIALQNLALRQLITRPTLLTLTKNPTSTPLIARLVKATERIEVDDTLSRVVRKALQESGKVEQWSPKSIGVHASQTLLRNDRELLPYRIPYLKSTTKPAKPCRTSTVSGSLDTRLERAVADAGLQSSGAWS